MQYQLGYSPPLKEARKGRVCLLYNGLSSDRHWRHWITRKTKFDPKTAIAVPRCKCMYCDHEFSAGFSRVTELKEVLAIIGKRWDMLRMLWTLSTRRHEPEQGGHGGPLRDDRPMTLPRRCLAPRGGACTGLEPLSWLAWPSRSWDRWHPPAAVSAAGVPTISYTPSGATS